MGTIRALTSGGGERRRAAQSTNLRSLFEGCIPGGFLLPPNHPACTHVFVGLDSGYCVCRECGSEHFCGCGACPETVTRLGERICQITGCVTLENELREERDVNVRTGPSMMMASHNKNNNDSYFDTLTKSSNNSNIKSTKNEIRTKKRMQDSTDNNDGEEPIKKKIKKAAKYPLMAKKYQNGNNNISSKKKLSCGMVSASISELVRRGGGENLRNLIEGTVREILSSDKTERCIEQERKRNEIKELSVFSRGLREVFYFLIFFFLWC